MQVFVLTDKAYQPVSRMSAPEGVSVRDLAVRHAMLTCGHIRGVLSAFGVESTIDYDVTQLPTARFTVTLLKKVSIAEAALAGDKDAEPEDEEA